MTFTSTMINSSNGSDTSFVSESISEQTGSDGFCDSLSVSSALDEPLSAEMLVARIGPRIYWEAAHHILTGSNAMPIVPDGWRVPLVETFNAGPPTLEPHDISYGLRASYVEAKQTQENLRFGDLSSNLTPPNNLNLIKVSLKAAQVSKSLRNTLDALPRWVNECYLPLMRCAIRSNDLIEDVSLHLPSPPGNSLCEDVFQDETLAALRTETAFVPAALRLSTESICKTVPNLPRVLESTQSSLLSPRYCAPDQAQNLELFSALFEWHPYHLGIQYQDNANSHPGLWCHGRMAATSLTRHLHWLGIQAPVIVVQFDFERVAFHVNWLQIVGGRLRCTSAPIWPPNATTPSSNRRSLLKSLDLRKPAEAVQVGLILSNLDHYTSSHFLEQVTRRLSEGPIHHCDSRSWKINISALPGSMEEVEGSCQWKEEQEIQAERHMVPEHPPDIRSWLEKIC